MTESRQKVVFVCLGNICRSPQAEYIVAQRASERGLADKFIFESAGTGDWHVGNRADTRSQAKAREHGIDMHAHRAQQITAKNTRRWDWFVAMDRHNQRDLMQMGVPADRILMMRQAEAGFANNPDVPDPHYGAGDGFETVYQILLQNADAILDVLNEKAVELRA